MSKRGSSVPPTPLGDDDPWSVVFGKLAAGKTWRELRNGKLKKRLDKLAVTLATNPRWAGAPSRHHRMSGELGYRKIDGVDFEVWEHEISSGGRVRFLIEDASRTVHIIQVSPGHPSDTK